MEYRQDARTKLSVLGGLLKWLGTSQYSLVSIFPGCNGRGMALACQLRPYSKLWSFSRKHKGKKKQGQQFAQHWRVVPFILYTLFFPPFFCIRELDALRWTMWREWLDSQPRSCPLKHVVYRHVELMNYFHLNLSYLPPPFLMLQKRSLHSNYILYSYISGRLPPEALFESTVFCWRLLLACELHTPAISTRRFFFVLFLFL